MDNSLSTRENAPQPQIRRWHIALAVAVLIIAYAISAAVGGEFAQIMIAGLQTLPFVALAVLAYLGIERFWARIVTILWLGVLVVGIGVLGLGLSAALMISADPSGPLPLLADGGAWRLAALIAGNILAAALGATLFVPTIRRRLSRIIPIDPDSFVHAVALGAVVTLTLQSFIPLLALTEPPLLGLIDSTAAAGIDPTGGRGDAGMLRDLIYGLLWTIPGTVVAVGYGMRRTLTEALSRLGLARPTWRQVGAGLLAAVALVIFVQILSQGINWFWGLMGWPLTDESAFGELLAFAMHPLGAAVIGVTAGLGEELAVRGVLQPRLGILLSNLFFTGLHAFQYNWDALLVVFLVGTALGIVRKQSNTTTAAIVHGVYNFLLVIIAIAPIPGLSQ